MRSGKVFLVGAGPGDPGLITQKAIECLTQANVVVHDRLLSPALLLLTPPTTEKLYVGKASGSHSSEQEEINRLLIDKAKSGETVVRLKGGDPFVFGRGGEEAEALQAEGIPFEVVPGVSSSVAVPAYAGIPVTHRDIASSFAVVTGHEDPNKPISRIDWAKLATSVDTLVFVMGMQNLPDITKKLLENGRASNTPVAVIKDGTLPQQKTVVGTLTNIAAKVKQQKLKPPAVIVVGDVVKLRRKLQWFDNRPLSGKRVLVTRARQQASSLSRLLLEHGAQPVELPAIDIRPISETSKLDAAILKVKLYNWILFTSVNGVETFFNRVYSLGFDARYLHNNKIGAIGPATARALKTKGISADYTPEVYTGRALLSGLDSYDLTGKRVLLPRADIADKELSQGLIERGALVNDIPVYQTAMATPDSKAMEMLLSGQIDIITFTSSSTVSNLLSVLEKAKAKVNHKIKVACIGPKTADTAGNAGLKVHILAREQTIPGLVAAIIDYYRKES